MTTEAKRASEAAYCKWWQAEFAKDTFHEHPLNIEYRAWFAAIEWLRGTEEYATMKRAAAACLAMFPDGEEYCGTAADLVSDAADALRKAGLDGK